MKVLLGCDVDPVLPDPLARRPATDIWTPLAQIDALVGAMGEDLPPITWLIRADESVRFATGSYVSGYVAKERRWQWLVNRGHELGWHMHLMSFDDSRGSFVFDASPSWLHEAHDSLEPHFAVRATRTGWDYGSTALFAALDGLGVSVDFSAVPGNLAWYQVRGTVVEVDWTRCAAAPYYPSRTDYQTSGGDALAMLEVPVAQFPNPGVGMVRRAAWRIAHKRPALSGLGNRTRVMTELWPDLPKTSGEIWAFHFHPEFLAGDGLQHFTQNVERLRREVGAEFVTASELVASLQAGVVS